MFIKTGDIISISHYSIDLPVKSIVLDVVRETSDDLLSVRVTKELGEGTLIEGDPLAIGFEKNNKIYLTNSYIYEVKPEKALVRIGVNNDEFIINHRAFERFPVSISANVMRRDCGENFTAVVKNISLSGLMICLNQELDKGQKLDLSIFFNEDTIRLVAEVVWKMQKEKNCEYGLKAIYMDYHNQNLLNRYLNNLKIKQEEFINQLKLEANHA